MTEDRPEALARLDVLVGEWTVEARFPGLQTTPTDPTGAPVMARSRFEWALDRQFLLQRNEIPIPEAPDSLSIIGTDPATEVYTQHYFDARGVARLYAMTFTGRVWTLRRESPDFAPLDFQQRFTGTLSEDANAISGVWEVRHEGGDWEHDFTLDYRRVA